MQLDADEDGEPFFKPPSVSTAPIPKSGEPQSQGEREQQPQQAPRDSEETLAAGEVETSQAAAAASATVEQEE